MATLAEQVQCERMARIVLSMIAEPDHLTTGYILGRHGGVATLSLVESDHDVTGLGRANVLLWRERLRARIAPDLMERVAEAEQHGFGTLIPADREWPAGLDELGDRAPLRVPLREVVPILHRLTMRRQPPVVGAVRLGLAV